MKNHFKFLGIIAVIAVIGLSQAGCHSTITVADTGSVQNITIPAMDFEVLGVVRHQAVVRNDNGERITYDALLRAAEARGGHALANLMIDVRREYNSFLFWRWNITETWYGSALAIRFTEALPADAPTSTGTQSIQAGGGTANGGRRRIPIIGGLFGN